MLALATAQHLFQPCQGEREEELPQVRLEGGNDHASKFWEEMTSKPLVRLPSR
jgi:hypothetical protein